MPGDDLDHVAFAVGEMRGEAKLVEHDDLAARRIDRQHRRDLAHVQDVARLDRGRSVLLDQRQLETGVFAKARGDRLGCGHGGLRIEGLGGKIGQPRLCALFVVRHRGGPIAPPRPAAPLPA
jgi:hypothetical protein